MLKNIFKKLNFKLISLILINLLSINLIYSMETEAVEKAVKTMLPAIKDGTGTSSLFPEIKSATKSSIPEAKPEKKEFLRKYFPGMLVVPKHHYLFCILNNYTNTDSEIASKLADYFRTEETRRNGFLDKYKCYPPEENPHGPNIIAQFGEDYQTPLNLAIMRRLYESKAVLLKNGADRRLR